MRTPPTADVTHLLLAWRQGDAGALNRLLPLVYEELHHLAHAQMRGESPGDRVLQTTALVHEAFLRLAPGVDIAWQDRMHFYAICARVMRRVLIDRARERRSLKRGGDERRVSLTNDVGVVPARDEDLLALDEALGGCRRSTPEWARSSSCASSPG